MEGGLCNVRLCVCVCVCVCVSQHHPQLDSGTCTYMYFSITHCLVKSQASPCGPFLKPYHVYTYARQAWTTLFTVFLVCHLFCVAMAIRFSLLLLEFGEIYFEDFSVIYYPSTSTEQEAVER